MEGRIPTAHEETSEEREELSLHERSTVAGAMTFGVPEDAVKRVG